MRDKLIELIENGLPCPDGKGPFGEECETCRYMASKNCVNERVADYLISHGVTFAEDNNVGKWIPVSERLPDTIPNSAGTAYSDAVNALTSGRKVITAIWDGEDFIGDADFWEAEDEEITHWTPVLLPLPELPTVEDDEIIEDCEACKISWD